MRVEELGLTLMSVRSRNVNLRELPFHRARRSRPPPPGLATGTPPGTGIAQTRDLRLGAHRGTSHAAETEALWSLTPLTSGVTPLALRGAAVPISVSISWVKSPRLVTSCAGELARTPRYLPPWKRDAQQEGKHHSGQKCMWRGPKGHEVRTRLSADYPRCLTHMRGPSREAQAEALVAHSDLADHDQVGTDHQDGQRGQDEVPAGEGAPGGWMGALDVGLEPLRSPCTRRKCGDRCPA